RPSTCSPCSCCHRLREDLRQRLPHPRELRHLLACDERLEYVGGRAVVELDQCRGAIDVEYAYTTDVTQPRGVTGLEDDAVPVCLRRAQCFFRPARDDRAVGQDDEVVAQSLRSEEH